MRKALIVGLNEYKNGSNLNGCVEDASKIENMLKSNADGSPNFQTKLVTQKEHLSKSNLTELINELFDDNENIDIALFYFSGHGHVDKTDGYLVTYEAEKNNYGIRTSTIQKIISQSKFKNKIIILDCCYSGSLGSTVNEYGLSSISEIPKNTTILSASRESEVAIETVSGGLFTILLYYYLKLYMVGVLMY